LSSITLTESVHDTHRKLGEHAAERTRAELEEKVRAIARGHADERHMLALWFIQLWGAFGRCAKVFLQRHALLAPIFAATAGDDGAPLAATAAA
jgi:hypothetical protein